MKNFYKLINILFVLLVLCLADIAQSQTETKESITNHDQLRNSEIKFLQIAHEGFELRKLYVANNNATYYENSSSMLRQANNLLQDINTNYSEAVDLDFYNTISESIINVMNESPQRTKLLNNTEKALYITYLMLNKSKIDSKLDLLNSEYSEDNEDSNGFYIGDVVKLGNRLHISVEKVGRWYPDNPFMEPSKNKIFYFVLIYIKNTGNESYMYSTYNFSLKDSDGFVYGASIWSREPDLSFGSILPGDIVRGYATFEIPFNKIKGLKFLYSPSLFGDYLTIHLTK